MSQDYDFPIDIPSPERLAIVLIDEHITNAKLVTSLVNIGLDPNPFLVDYHDAIFMLLNIQHFVNEELTEWYLEQLSKAREQELPTGNISQSAFKIYMKLKTIKKAGDIPQD